MSVKEDGGWRSRLGGVLGFFALFITFIPLLRSALGIKIATMATSYHRYGLIIGAIGIVVSLFTGKGWGGWRLMGFLMSSFACVCAVAFMMLSAATSFFE